MHIFLITDSSKNTESIVPLNCNIQSLVSSVPCRGKCEAQFLDEFLTAVSQYAECFSGCWDKVYTEVWRDEYLLLHCFLSASDAARLFIGLATTFAT
jgi:hypothetical protein